MTVWMIAICAASTLVLWLYTHVYLPRLMAERYNQSFRSFSKAIDLRWPGSGVQGERVVQLAGSVARQLRLPARTRQDLEMAAWLQDIGLCAVPYQVLNSDQPLQPGEIDSHCEAGAAMIEQVPSLRHIAGYVRWHEKDNDSLDRAFRILPAVNEFWKLAVERGEPYALEAMELNSAGFSPEVVRAIRAEWGGDISDAEREFVQS